MRVPLPALLGGSVLLLLLLRWRRRRALWRKVAEAQERQERSLVRMEAAVQRFREQVSGPRCISPRGILTWAPSPPGTAARPPVRCLPGSLYGPTGIKCLYFPFLSRCVSASQRSPLWQGWGGNAARSSGR